MTNFAIKPGMELAYFQAEDNMQTEIARYSETIDALPDGAFIYVAKGVRFGAGKDGDVFAVGAHSKISMFLEDFVAFTGLPRQDIQYIELKETAEELEESA